MLEFEARWLDMVWSRAVSIAVNETGLDVFPEDCPWVIEEEVLAQGWLPAHSEKHKDVLHNPSNGR